MEAVYCSCTYLTSVSMCPFQDKWLKIDTCCNLGAVHSAPSPYLVYAMGCLCLHVPYMYICDSSNRLSNENIYFHYQAKEIPNKLLNYLLILQCFIHTYSTPTKSQKCNKEHVRSFSVNDMSYLNQSRFNHKINSLTPITYSKRPAHIPALAIWCAPN